jgi:pimeloyl-ACP methyl ester carboxylesterase
MPRKNGLYYRESLLGGSSEGVLIWLHGAGGAGEQWPHQLRRIPGWRVLALDLPGHGRSEGQALPTIQTYAQELGAWLDELGIESAVIGGHSMGAAIGLQLALERSEQVSALILLGAGAQMPVNPDLLSQLAITAQGEAPVDQIARWSFSNDARQGQRETMAAMLRATQRGVLIADFQACARFDVSDRLKFLGKPALVISGEKDLMVPAHRGERLAGGLSRGSFVEIKGVGHMVMQEAPRQVTQHVTAFLTSLYAG